MFVLTADQIDSRHDRDRAVELIDELTARFGPAFTLPPDQTAGDEIQVMLTDARTTFDALLHVHRTGHWSTGLGIGGVRTPLPASSRQASGGAFIAARDGVTRAKRADARFALAVENASTRSAPADVEAFIAMLLLLRQRRTIEGWEVVDLLEGGLNQAEAAERIGISTAAVSQRVKNALWRVEESARPGLVRLLENLDRGTSEMESTA